jgi:hypothetical protein
VPAQRLGGGALPGAQRPAGGPGCDGRSHRGAGA